MEDHRVYHSRADGELEVGEEGEEEGVGEEDEGEEEWKEEREVEVVSEAPCRPRVGGWRRM